MKQTNKILMYLITGIILGLLYLLRVDVKSVEPFSGGWTSDTELVIVSSHFNEDLDWLLKAPVPVVVCGKEGEKPAAIASDPKCQTINQGNEASSYIKFILAYYDQLPQYMLFIHGHESAWHQQTDIYKEINEHKWLNKKYYTVNKSGLVDGHFPAGDYVVDWFKLLWDPYFRPYLKRDPPKKVKVDCCAQFIISREAILQYPKEAWEKWYLLLTTEFINYKHTRMNSSKLVAVVFEYLWHIIFGQPDEMTEL